MRALFYEPNHTGHHFAYLERMLPGFVDLPITLGLATTRDAIESTEFQESLARLGDRVEVLPICRPAVRGAQVRNALRRVADLRRAIDQWKPDHVAIAYADGMWQLLAAETWLPRTRLLAGVTSEAWVFRGGFAYHGADGWTQRAKRAAWRRMLQRGLFSKVHLHDELLYEFSRSVPGSRTEVTLAPDPVDVTVSRSRAESRAALQLPQDGHVLGCLGMADSRKGVHLALEAVASLLRQQERATPIRLLIAGPHSEEIRARLAAPDLQPFLTSGAIVSLDRFLNDQEMGLAAAACNLVLAPYPNHSGRSSIILWAAAAGVPVLAVDRGCIQHVVQAERLGATCNVADTNAFAEAILATLGQGWTEADAERVRRYALWHSIENYQHESTGLIRALLQEER